MKKLITLFAASALTIGSLYAGVVNSDIAKTVAASFYSQNFGKSASTLTLVYTEYDATGTASYYVFNINSKDGFVIVSAEDAGHPIIGCSNTGNFVVPTTRNNNIGFWMQRRNTEIGAMRANHAKANSEIADEWTSYSNNVVPNALRKPITRKVQSSLFPSPNAYLVQSTYDQEAPYWDDCPGTGTNKSVTGCVATAMTQIMRYWKYPSVGQGSSSYCDCTGSGYSAQYGTLKANYNHPYGWSAMTLVNPPSSDTTLARAMSDAGISVEMDYDPSGSGAQVFGPGPSAQTSYSSYFKYSTTIMDGVNESSDTVAWQDTLMHDLDCGRPIQYEGFTTTDEGHTWVCDGYNSINFFHMNWGWSGYDNGWYSINNLNTGQYDFTNGLGALIGIMPPATVASPVAEFVASTKKACESNPVQYFDVSTNQPTSWMWTFTGGTPATSTLQNPAVSYAKPGTYAVELIASNGFGSDSLISTSYITVSQIPLTPTVTRVGDTLICTPSNYSSYTWTKSNVIITGATSYKLGMTTNGVYKVTINDDTTGCSAGSIPYPETSVGISEVSLNSFIKAYPNPTNGNLQVAFNMPSDGDYTVSLTNVLGQTVYSNSLHVSGEYTKNINLTSFTKGVYFLSVIGKDSKGVQKIVLY